MFRTAFLSVPAAALLMLSTACNTGQDAQADPAVSPSADAAADPKASPEVQQLRAHVAELAARPEQAGLGRVKVAHILISFTGAGTSATRSRAEAEQLAAELWQKVRDPNTDFTALMREHSDDTGPGVYGMFASPSAKQGDDYPRAGMVPAFGNVGWRLAVGEIGVAGHDPGTSRYGWHIIRRVE